MGVGYNFPPVQILEWIWGGKFYGGVIEVDGVKGLGFEDYSILGYCNMGHSGLLVVVLVIMFLKCKICDGLEDGHSMVDRKKLSVTTPDYEIYHRMESLLSEVDALIDRHPRTMRRELVSKVVDGYSTKMSIITVSTGGFNDQKNEGSLRLLVNFGEHARELVTSEMALRVLQILAGERNITSSSSKGDGQQQLTNLLPLLVLKIIPMENVNGRVKVEAGDFCERKNGRGVDTNRNWGVDWGKKEKDYDANEEYPGTSPFSEPETQILREVVRELAPHVWMNVHSGMEALFMPYDHKRMVPSDVGGVAVAEMLQLVNELHCDGRCAVGSGGTSVGYLSHGTATDYVYDVSKVPVALTLEIFGDEAAPNEDCFRMFNPTTNKQLESVVSKWSAIFFSLLLNLPPALLKMRSRRSGSLWWAKPNPAIQDASLVNQLMAMYMNDKPKKFGRVWHGLDAMADGSRTADMQISLQFYFMFCVLLLILSWFRCSRYLKRFLVRICPRSWLYFCT